MQPSPSDWRAQLQVTALDLTLAPRIPWRLPPDPAQLLRSTLGKAMVDLCCVADRFDCARCDLRDRCEIPTWYEPGGNAPRPLLPEAVTPGGAAVAPDQPWRVRLWLLGEAPRPALIPQAVVRLARAGLGPDRVPHRVVELLARGGRLARAVDEDREFARLPEPASLAEFCRSGRASELETRSPLCLDTPAPTVGDLLWAALGRVRQVARSQGVALSLRWPDPRPLRRPWDEARWVTGRRVSSGGGPHDLSGWTGRITLDDELAPWADLLTACEVLGVGRNLSAGRGRFRLRGGAAQRAAIEA